MNDRQLKNGGRGFTMIELLLVITMMLILISVAIPNYRRSVQTAREAALRQNLATMRTLIQEFTLDKKRAPTSLSELVSERYIREIPKDIGGSTGTWQEESCSTYFSVDQTDTGLCDVRSGAEGFGADGTAYSEW